MAGFDAVITIFVRKLWKMYVRRQGISITMFAVRAVALFLCITTRKFKLLEFVMLLRCHHFNVVLLKITSLSSKYNPCAARRRPSHTRYTFIHIFVSPSSFPPASFRHHAVLHHHFSIEPNVQALQTHDTLSRFARVFANLNRFENQTKDD